MFVLPTPTTASHNILRFRFPAPTAVFIPLFLSYLLLAAILASERFSAAAPPSIARKSKPRSAVGGERGRFSTIYRRASYTRCRLGRREEDEGGKARLRGRGKSDAGATQRNGGDGRHVRGLWGSKHETSMLFVQNGEVQYSGEECQASHWEDHKRLGRANGTRTVCSLPPASGGSPTTGNQD